MKLRIAETFYSIQGEGGLVGVPSFFIRTSGCNLRCVWCDTPYASWHPEGGEMTVEELCAAAEATPARHVVLTGGEPMLAPGLPALAAALRERGMHITIETAGTLPPEGIACDLASISPKLANSDPPPELFGPGWAERHRATRRRPDVLRQWAAHCAVQWKFVISSAADIDEARSLLDSLGIHVEPATVILMPEGTKPEAVAARYALLVDACKTRGYRLSPRLHLDLFGNRRGT
jgi:7-carboxy-7-deazaguanine synthase